jgi:hypothetical protein
MFVDPKRTLEAAQDHTTDRRMAPRHLNPSVPVSKTQ